MPEQKSREFVEELVGLFELTNREDMQEAMRADLAQRAPEEMAREFALVEGLLRGLVSTAEDSIGYGAYLILAEARQHAQIARGICETYAER